MNTLRLVPLASGNHDLTGLRPDDPMIQAVRWPGIIAESPHQPETEETCFSGVEILPDYAHCGINE